jgi:hypothetical protein
VACGHFFGAKTQPFHDARSEALNQGIGRFDQCPRNGAIRLGLQVKRDGAFTPVHGGAGVSGRFLYVGCTVHHNHVSPHVGQHHACKGAGSYTGKFNNSQAV